MITRCIILLGLLIIALQMTAQEDYVVSVHRNGELTLEPTSVVNMNARKMPEYFSRSYQPLRTFHIDSMLQHFTPELSTIPDERPLDRQIASSAYLPFFSAYTPMLRRISPMALDFNETSVVPISSNLSLLANGRQYTWPGAGGTTFIRPELSWTTGRLTLSGGLLAGRYYSPLNFHSNAFVGTSASASFQVNDKIDIRGWGQYVNYGNDDKNPHLQLNPFFNHSDVGGAIELHRNENFGLGVGVDYQFNPIRRKWDRRTLVYPIFYK